MLLVGWKEGTVDGRKEGPEEGDKLGEEEEYGVRYTVGEEEGREVEDETLGDLVGLIDELIDGRSVGVSELTFVIEKPLSNALCSISFGGRCMGRV